MSTSIYQSILNLMRGDIATNAGKLLGMNAEQTNQTLAAAIPSLLSGLLYKGQESVEEKSNIFNLAIKAQETGVLDELGSLTDEEDDDDKWVNRSMNWLKKIFGDQTNTVIETIAKNGSTTNENAEKLLSLTAPVGLAGLGKAITENNWDISSFWTQFNNEKSSIAATLPGDLADVFGFASPSAFVGKANAAISNNVAMKMGGNQTSEREVAAAVPTGGGKWLLGGLIIAGVAGLGYWLWKQNGNNSNSLNPITAVIDSTKLKDSLNKVANANDSESVLVKLPNDIELNAQKNGIEDQLVAYIKDASATIDKNKWFNFNALNFNTGTAELTSDSKMQIENIAKILNAFPKVQLKIGGYTDKVGDENANKTLSQKRAEVVAKAIQELLTDKKQIVGAEGYGSKFAAEPSTASDEARRKDRRISVNVRTK